MKMSKVNTEDIDNESNYKSSLNISEEHSQKPEAGDKPSLVVSDSLSIPMDRLEKLRELERKIGYTFNDINLLELALTHKSYVGGEGEHFECNERMEFLGDSVIGLVVNSFLYNKFATYTEGQLSKLKAVAVSRSTLALCARELGLGDFIKFGAGEIATDGGGKTSNLSNALEALVAALYLDGGLKNSEKFVLKILKDKIYELDSDELKRDYKTALQEYWQAGSRKPPSYIVIAETGPDHDKRFEIEVRLAGESYGRGTGRNKKEAEQKAAEKALETMLDRRKENGSEC
jgi:ribonuclease-3